MNADPSTYKSSFLLLQTDTLKKYHLLYCTKSYNYCWPMYLAFLLNKRQLYRKKKSSDKDDRCLANSVRWNRASTEGTQLNTHFKRFSEFFFAWSFNKWGATSTAQRETNIHDNLCNCANWTQWIKRTEIKGSYEIRWSNGLWTQHVEQTRTKRGRQLRAKISSSICGWLLNFLYSIPATHKRLNNFQNGKF